MKKLGKIIASVNALCLIASTCALLGCGEGGGGGGASSNKIKLYFDGGGGSGNYNTSRTYNTLETLAAEWNETNDEYEVVINEKSLGGNRSSITSMLTATTAPDMLMQVGSVKNDDIGNGWYVALNEYLTKPNPYEEGNTAWGDMYGVDAIESSKSSDGNNYYVCLDNIAIGMMYNMDLLKAAGVESVPKTHSDFIACLEKLQTAKDKGVISAEVYCPNGLWHESYIGNSVYGAKIAEWDEDQSGTVSTKELIDAYKEDKWSIDDDRFEEFLRLCGEKAEYYPNNYLGYDVPYKFAKGELAVTDAIGNSMVTLAANAKSKFEVKVAGYPRLDTNASKYGGYTTRRGSAGQSSAYWVTNSAISKGEGAVDACVDFLMFLTAADNNSRLVNDLGTALPLKIEDSTVSLFAGLAGQYEMDVSNDKSLMWSACYIPEMLGTSFNDHYQLAMGDYYEDPNDEKTGDINAVVTTLKPKAEESIADLISRYGWEY